MANYTYRAIHTIISKDHTTYLTVKDNAKTFVDQSSSENIAVSLALFTFNSKEIIYLDIENCPIMLKRKKDICEAIEGYIWAHDTKIYINDTYSKIIMYTTHSAHMEVYYERLIFFWQAESTKYTEQMLTLIENCAKLNRTYVRKYKIDLHQQFNPYTIAENS